MEFEKPEELKMIQSAVHDFVSEQLKPLERTVLGRAADISDAQMYLSPDEEQALAAMARDMGLWGIGLPEELGGAGLGTLGACLIEEELAQTVVPFSFGDVPPVLFDCTEQQREDYLTPALERQKYPLLALLEPDGKSNAEDLQAKAEEKAQQQQLLERKHQQQQLQERHLHEKQLQAKQEDQRQLDGRIISYGQKVTDSVTDYKQNAYNRAKVEEAYTPAKNDTPESRRPQNRQLQEAIDIVV